MVSSAHGSTIYDQDGTAYLDAMAGLWCVNIGYGRGELADVAADQMQQLAYFPHTQMNIPAAALAEKVNTLVGGDYHVYFVNSGSEANEAGFKIARQYQKHEKPGEFRFKTVSRYYSYHGTTLATLDAGGMGDRKGKFEPYSGVFLHVAAPTCYRCPFGLSYPSLQPGLREEHARPWRIVGEGPETVAEIIIEPIMSGVGVAVPPDEYLPEVEKICRKYGILLHIDEVINGFGHHRQDVRAPALRCGAGHHRNGEGYCVGLPADRRHGGEEQGVQQLLWRAASENRQVVPGEHLWRPSGVVRCGTAQHRDHGGGEAR